MALTLTKKVTVIWGSIPEPSAEWQVAKEQYIAECVAQGITDGVWTGDWTTSSRCFTDQTSAETFLTRWLEIHAQYGHVPASTSITDL
jgi:hypothetical protein